MNVEAPRELGISDISWKEAPYIVGSGMCMGTADVVPGVSGGTMAVALGIYARLLGAIASINMHAVSALLKLQLKRVFEILHWRFLVCLVGGIGVAVVVMLKIVKLPHLIETQPTLVYAVFFGLVLASAIILLKKVPVWSAWRGALLVLGTAIGFAIVNLVPVQTPETGFFLFLCGALSICAMLLPGISGSFVLLILGKYEYVLGALTQLLSGEIGALSVIIPFCLGLLVGVAAFARFLGWLLNKWEHSVLAFLTGLLFGTLWRIWPYQHLEKIVVRGKERVITATPYWPEAWELSVAALMVVGLGVVLAIERVATRRAAGAV